MSDNTHDRIFDKLDEIGERLAALGATCPAREKRLDAIDTRLRQVEAVQNKAIGIVTVVSLFFGAIGVIVTSIVKRALAQ